MPKYQRVDPYTLFFGLFMEPYRKAFHKTFLSFYDLEYMLKIQSQLILHFYFRQAKYFPALYLYGRCTCYGNISKQSKFIEKSFLLPLHLIVCWSSLSNRNADFLRLHFPSQDTHKNQFQMLRLVWQYLDGSFFEEGQLLFWRFFAC